MTEGNDQEETGNRRNGRRRERRNGGDIKEGSEGEYTIRKESKARRRKKGSEKEVKD
jgi:hypothetical protein